MKKALILALASLWFGHAAAATYTVSCNGCDEAGMVDAATRATGKGTVYVFDAIAGDARKFSVETEIISLTPYWAFTWGDEIPIETDIKNAFGKFVTTLHDIDPYEPVILPPDFPIRSVAGALLDPGAATIRIVDFLRSQQNYEQLQLNGTALIMSLLKRNVPFLNLSDLLQTNKVIVEFADGSTAEFEIYFSVNVASATANLELRRLGNARMADGSPAPTTKYGFRDFSVKESNQSLREWILWANYHGIPVSGTSSGDGTTMVCRVEGSTVYCVVKKRR